MFIRGHFCSIMAVNASLCYYENMNPVVKIQKIREF